MYSSSKSCVSASNIIVELHINYGSNSGISYIVIVKFHERLGYNNCGITHKLWK